MIWLLTIAVLYLFWSQNKLSKQISELKKTKTAPLAEKSLKKAPDVPKKPEIPYDPARAAAGWPKRDKQPAALTTPTPSVSVSKGAKPVQKTPANNSNFVFNADKIEELVVWFRENWFLGIAALSLALAGVFLVQYGVENGFLTPFWRVMGALALGVGLIAAGEVIRRRSGDDADQHTAFLPSTFSGAGIVTLFVAVLSARHLYGLIGAEFALVALVAISVISVVLGWFYGPFMSAIGIIGSTAAPFLIGGQSDTPEVFYYYFALIALAGLAIDSLRRWAWISALALIANFAAAFLLYVDVGVDPHFIAFTLIATLGAVIIPRRSLTPTHGGTSSFDTAMVLLSKSDKSVIAYEFPTRLAAGSVTAATAAALIVAFRDTGTAVVWLSLAALSFLYIATIVWMRRAPALADLAVLPAIAFLSVIFEQGADFGSLRSEFWAGLQREPESQPPYSVTVLVLISAIGSALAHWRGLFGQLSRVNIAWSSAAAIFAPLAMIIIGVLWRPAPVLGVGFWAAHAMSVGAIMVFFAGQCAQKDGGDRRRAAIYALSAITMISFALVVMLTSAALTIALAVMVLGAVLADRKFDLPLLSWAVQVGAVVIGWRLVIWPGIGWAMYAPLAEIWAAYGLTVALLAASWYFIEKGRWNGAKIVVESAIWLILAVFATVLLLRLLDNDVETHAGVSLVSSVWLISAFVQLYRMRIPDSPRFMQIIRRVLATVFGLIAFVGFAVILSILNPLSTWGGSVSGPYVFDSLLVAYGVPAAIFAAGYWVLDHLKPSFRKSFLVGSAAFIAFYATMEIRRFWRGDDLSVRGVIQPELYSYTIALLLVSVALLFFAFARRSLILRRVAMVGIGLTIAKVFLVDMAGLAGLLRVASFLGLGLSLAGLAWIDRAMSARWDDKSAAG